MKWFGKLKPKGKSAASLREALEKAEGEFKLAKQAVAEMEVRQAEVLLDGSEDEGKALVRDLRAGRDACDGLAASIELLKSRLVATEAEEATAAINAEIAAFDAEAQAIADTIKQDYLRMIEPLLRLAAREHALEAWVTRLAGNIDAAKRKGAKPVRDSAPALPNHRLDGVGCLHHDLRLPTIGNMHGFLWPAPMAEMNLGPRNDGGVLDIRFGQKLLPIGRNGEIPGTKVWFDMMKAAGKLKPMPKRRTAAQAAE